MIFFRHNPPAGSPASHCEHWSADTSDGLHLIALVSIEQPGDVLHVSLSVQSETSPFVRKPSWRERLTAVQKWFPRLSVETLWGETQPNVFHILEKK
jgi:hypothetical protein